jgi:hypothetical protein
MSHRGKEPRFESTILTDKQTNAVSNPAPGTHKYINRFGQLWSRSSSGAETLIAGGSSGELNLVTNPSDASNWTAGTGYTLATTTSSGDLPLASVISTAIKITSSTGVSNEATLAQTNYITITQSEALKNKKLKIEFYLRPGTNFTSNEWTVSIYSGSTRMNLSTDSSGITYIPNVTGKFTTTFDADDSSTYTLRFARTVNAGTNVGVLSIAGVVVGPGVQPQGAVVDSKTPYTPSSYNGIGTPSNVDLSYTRIGEYALIEGRLQLGTVTAAEARIALPSGLTVGAFNGQTTHVVGRWSSNSTTANTPKQGTVIVTTGEGFLKFSIDDYTNTTNAFTAQNGSAIFSSSITISLLSVFVPIAEWSGSGVVNLAQNDVEFAFNANTSDADNTTAFGYGPQGVTTPVALSASRYKRVRFLTPILPTDTIRIQFSKDRVSWFDVGTGYNQDIAAFTRQENDFHGISFREVSGSSTDIDVHFGRFRIASNSPTYGASGINWSTSVGFWRVVKARAGAAIGFGTVSQNSAGLFPSDHSRLDDATATRLGLKAYSHGTTYNGGNSPTIIMLSGGTLSSALTFIYPRQLSAGSWVVSGEGRIILNSTARTSIALRIDGMIASGARFAVQCHQLDAAAAFHFSYGDANTGSDQFRIQASHASATTSEYVFLFTDVPLTGKPTWAY